MEKIARFPGGEESTESVIGCHGFLRSRNTPPLCIAVLSGEGSEDAVFFSGNLVQQIGMDSKTLRRHSKTLWIQVWEK